MNYLHRIAVPFINALFITGALLYLMFLLVRTNQPELRQGDQLIFPPISIVEEDSALKPIVNRPTRPEIVEELPEVPIENAKVELNPIEGVRLGDFKPTKPQGERFSLDNTQLVLALGFPPIYPRGPISRGVEGFAVVGFSVDASGSVFDPFIIESEPGSVFDRASLKAISKFKYKAKHVDGKPVVAQGQRYMFTYKIDS